MKLSVRCFTVVVLGLVLFFYAAHIFFAWVNLAFGYDYIFGLAPLFRLDSEKSLSTWYSTLALSFSALLLFAIHRAKSAQLEPFLKHWLALALIFVFLSADEACSIHEKISILIRSHVSALGLLSGQWTLVYVFLLVIVAFVYFPFLKHLWPRPGIMFAVAGAVFLAGAVGLELVGAYYFAHVQLGAKDLPYLLIAGTEDLFEMLGILLWMRTLLAYMLQNTITLQIRPEC